MADISQPQIFSASAVSDGQAGSYFGQRAAISFKLSRRHQRIAKIKPDKSPMHLAA